MPEPELHPLLWRGLCRWERLRLWPLWLGAVAVGAYAAHGFLPAVSGHFSPRNVFQAYNAHAKPGEPLAEHQVGTRAATYYADGSVQEKASRRELVAYLGEEGRRWATFPGNILPQVDRDFRGKQQRHLFVASDPGARVVLVANQDVPGVSNQNPLTKTVLDEAPTAQHGADVSFEDKVELLGYNLKLPGGDYVGPGQKFEIEWIFRVLKNNIGTYKLFVHIDGSGNRVNGDHEAVEGKFPVKLWKQGDIILDRQTLSVPANFRAGRYQIMLGFFRGESRLKVTRGSHDGENRARVGQLQIR